MQVEKVMQFVLRSLKRHLTSSFFIHGTGLVHSCFSIVSRWNAGSTAVALISGQVGGLDRELRFSLRVFSGFGAPFPGDPLGRGLELVVDREVVGGRVFAFSLFDEKTREWDTFERLR
jgi:hypothetical protein